MDDVFRWLRAEWDRVAGFGLVGLGALLLVLGYDGVSRSPYVAQQLAYIVSGGLGGIFCLGFGSVLLVGADLHDDWRRLDRIEAAIRASVPASSGADIGGQRDIPTRVEVAVSVGEDDHGGNGNGRHVGAPATTGAMAATPRRGAR
jgi:hypothetical protein